MESEGEFPAHTHMHKIDNFISVEGLGCVLESLMGFSLHSRWKMRRPHWFYVQGVCEV